MKPSVTIWFQILRQLGYQLLEALADIVEVIKVNFLEDHDIEKVGKEDSVRDVDIKKLFTKVRGNFEICKFSALDSNMTLLVSKLLLKP